MLFSSLFASLLCSKFTGLLCDIVAFVVNDTTILGREYYTVFENKPYVAFYKIPYAEPPIGDLRFKPPKFRQWFPNKSYNYSNFPEENESTIVKEDCLYLTLFKPNCERESSFAVIVWLHENPNLNGPDFFIDENVIVINVSYRTAILGFLNTEDEFSRGNTAAKDILLALQWIRDNIIYFDGDPNRVTVIGSGRASNIVASFLLSPLAEDLFARVIIQSGSALSPAEYKFYNFEILNKLFWNIYGPYAKFNRTKLYERLQNASVEELIYASRGLFDSTEVRDDQRLINTFGLTVETTKKRAFMDELPEEMYKKGIVNQNIDVMMGFTSLESMYKCAGIVDNRRLLKYLNYNFQYLLPFNGRKDEYGSQRYKTIRRKIMDFYFVNGTIRERSLRRYAKYLSDQVIYPVLRQARLQADTFRNHVYLYRFSHKGSLNIVWASTLSNLNLTGATSGDEICYQFRCKYFGEAYGRLKSDERRFVKKFSRLLTNFAKYGNPTMNREDVVLGKLHWERLRSNQNMRIMNLGKSLKMIDLPEYKRMEFWEQLQTDYFSNGNVKDEL